VLQCHRSCVTCFFFQAEDGIRDGHVTGVQTCALPISSLPDSRAPIPPTRTLPAVCRTASRMATCHPISGPTTGGSIPPPSPFRRSEERSVGKECRSPWSPEHEKKKERMEQ